MTFAYGAVNAFLVTAKQRLTFGWLLKNWKVIWRLYMAGMKRLKSPQTTLHEFTVLPMDPNANYKTPGFG